MLYVMLCCQYPVRNMHLCVCCAEIDLVLHEGWGKSFVLFSPIAIRTCCSPAAHAVGVSTLLELDITTAFAVTRSHAGCGATCIYLLVAV